METKNSEQVVVSSLKVHQVVLEGEDVDALAEFAKHRKLFDELLSRGVFTTKAGSVTLHFDSAGVLKRIDTSHTTNLSTPVDLQQKKLMV